MKTKIVYVVVSEEKDIYLEQFYVSIKSLRYNSPGAYVILLTDQITAKTFTGLRKSFSEEADEIKIINLPENLSGQARSRLLKTSVRQNIAGDFLFIDCDTIILRSLDPVDSFCFDIAACNDSHTELKTNPYKTMIIEHGKINGIDFAIDKDYFNSGVIYVKDKKITHEFYNLWNILWKESFERGVFMDQPAFNKTNYIMNFPIHVLSDSWNCELKHGVRFLKEPHILHYLCTNVNAADDPQLYIMNNSDVLLNIKKTGKIPSTVSQCFDDHFLGFQTSNQMISGKDLDFLHSSYYALNKRIFQSSDEKKITWLIYKYFGLKNRIKRLIGKIKN